ncbi:MAG TPA: hypothetical protein VH349_07930 [Ktedonobacterales bacterium]|jgi:hypothetical protein
MEGYHGFVHRASWIILGVAPVVEIILVVRAPGRSKAERLGQLTAVMEDVLERLEAHG